MKTFDELAEFELLSFLAKSPEGLSLINQLSPDMFYLPQCKEIMKALKSLRSNGFDPSLADLFENDALDRTTLSMISACSSYLDGKEALKKVQSLWASRRIVDFINSSTDISGLQDLLNTISDSDQQVQAIRPSMIENERFKKSKHFGFFPYRSFQDLSFRSGELFIIGARPGVGKTTWMLNLALSLQGSSLIVSYEMSAEDLVKKMCNIKAIDLDERAYLDHVFLIDKPLSLESLLSSIRYHVKTNQTHVVFVDYIQLISLNKSSESYRIAMLIISRSLKALALDLGICIVALAQLKREADEMSPQLSHLKESSSFEADSDVVLLLEKSPENMISLLVYCRKNRRGPIFNKINLNFEKFSGVISDV